MEGEYKVLMTYIKSFTLITNPGKREALEDRKLLNALMVTIRGVKGNTRLKLD